MTIQGAMNELVNLLNADDIPIYYKGGIQKVIETISMELIEQNAKLQALDRRINLHEKAMAKVISESAGTPCSNCQEFDCYGCEYKQTERSER